MKNKILLIILTLAFVPLALVAEHKPYKITHKRYKQLKNGDEFNKDIYLPFSKQEEKLLLAMYKQKHAPTRVAKQEIVRLEKGKIEEPAKVKKMALRLLGLAMWGPHPKDSPAEKQSVKLATKFTTVWLGVIIDFRYIYVEHLKDTDMDSYLKLLENNKKQPKDHAK